MLTRKILNIIFNHTILYNDFISISDLFITLVGNSQKAHTFEKLSKLPEFAPYKDHRQITLFCESKYGKEVEKFVQILYILGNATYEDVDCGKQKFSRFGLPRIEDGFGKLITFDMAMYELSPEQNEFNDHTKNGDEIKRRKERLSGFASDFIDFLLGADNQVLENDEHWDKDIEKLLEYLSNLVDLKYNVHPESLGLGHADEYRIESGIEARKKVLESKIVKYCEEIYNLVGRIEQSAKESRDMAAKGKL